MKEMFLLLSPPGIMVLLSCAPALLYGQVRIAGRITDGQEHVPYATVQLLKPDSAFVKGVIASDSGNFMLDGLLPGHYLIAASAVGYERWVSGPYNLKGNATFSDFVLERTAQSLAEVSVKAGKPFVEERADRLVLNIRNSISSSGSTVLEILQKAPGVTINRQSGSIAMNGRTGVQLMVNGKMMQVAADVAIQMLDGMMAGNIEKIELIHSPSAKHDAEGNGGIINIVTSHGAEHGLNANIGLTLGQRWAETLGANGSITYRNRKWSWSADYALLRNHNLHIMEIERNSPTSDFRRKITVRNRRHNVTTQQNLNAGLEWQASEKVLFSLGFSGYKRNWQMTAGIHDTDRVLPDSTAIADTRVRQSNIWQSLAGSIGMVAKVGTGSELSIGVDYLYYHNDNPSSYDQTLLHEQSQSKYSRKTELSKTTPIRFWVGRADYKRKAFRVLTMETGVKFFVSGLDNDVVVQRLIASDWVVDPAFSERSLLDEQVGAAYVSATWQGGRRWLLTGGMRYEYTHTFIRTASGRIDRRYGYFFPSLLIKKELKPGHDLQISYSRRITRPTYSDIAPYSVFWSSNTFIAGNTSLWPAIADALRLSYVAGRSAISIQANHVKNEVATLQPQIDSLGTLIYRSENVPSSKTISLSGSQGLKLTSSWEIQGNFTLHYQTIRIMHLSHKISKDLVGLNANLTTVYSLPEDFSVELSGIFISRYMSGISEYLPSGSLNAGIQKKWGKHGTVKLAMDDILYTNKWRIRTYHPEVGLDLRFRYDWHNQFLRITYARNIGNSKLRTLKVKSGSEEERGRLGN
ncbi:TonB dependent receptor [Dyadobacter sp. CY261]|uniref:TonB-dependent receptor domain-containing protein n=1 Tax=Dyadobacter sp. CY261 TaxID=2907203 RepID=UPI001F313A7C|nr:TonB-dependent receptor [Dyadobacter sp. CY261]MCF0072897.1 TonB dependent receptor [Dyadobacter sp. CY261]